MYYIYMCVLHAMIAKCDCQHYRNISVIQTIPEVPGSRYPLH